MTKKLYENNALLKSCLAVVTNCQEDKGKYLVELDQTVFFPEGGGQLSDRGKLGVAQVSYVGEKDGHIYHHCDQPLEVGSEVEAVLDWQVRLDRMQQHCGEHILSYACWKLFQANNVGFHMHENLVTIDLDKALTDEELAQAELLTNEIIWENRPIHIDYMDSSEAAALADKMRKFNSKLQGLLRIVTVEDADICTCCGTHPPFTGMVGSVKIIRHEKHKTGCRVEFLCGQRALKDAAEKNALVLRIANGFSCKAEQVEEHLHKQEEEIAGLKDRLNKLMAKVLETQLADSLEQAPTCANGARLLVMALTEGDGKESKQLLQKVTALENTVSLLVMVQPARISYVVALSAGAAGNCQQYIRLVNEAFGGRGGGKPDLAQGGSNYCPDWQERLNLVKEKILGM